MYPPPSVFSARPRPELASAVLLEATPASIGVRLVISRAPPCCFCICFAQLLVLSARTWHCPPAPRRKQTTTREKALPSAQSRHPIRAGINIDRCGSLKLGCSERHRFQPTLVHSSSLGKKKKGEKKKNNGLSKSNDLTQLRNARVNASVTEGWQTKAWGGGKRPNHGKNEENQRKTTTKATFAKKEREFGRCTTAAAHLLVE